MLVFFAGVYGGYFVAAQGILLVGILGVFMTGTIQNANAMKNILVLGVNIIAACLLPPVRLRPDRLGRGRVIAVSSLIGGLVGSRVGRRLSPVVLRGVIFALGLVALGFMIANLFPSPRVSPSNKARSKIHEMTCP